MRIAFVSTVLNFPFGGSDTLWSNAASASLNRGDRLQVLVSRSAATSSQIQTLKARGAFIHERPAPTIPRTVFKRLEHKFDKLFGDADPGLRKLQEFCPDLVVFSLGGTYDLITYTSWIDWLEENEVRFRIIANWQMENPVLSELEWGAAKRALKLCERLFFVSSRNLESTRRHLLEPLSTAVVLHNPLRWQTTDTSPWPNSHKPLLATVSRLEEGKGIRILLHALASLSTITDWRLNIYGEGPNKGLLHATAEHLGVSSRVCFKGHVSSLREIWQENQLLVSPAVEDGVPMTIPEAMLCERPILATEVGGANDWLSDGLTGFLSPAATVPILTATLTRALQCTENWKQMGLAAAAYARRIYRPDDYLRVISP